MASIVKANTNLTSGGIAVLKRNFSASDTGQMTYSAEYCCLSQFASRWTPSFKTGTQPPTALPANMLLLQLTKTPTLVDLNTETVSGLTYFRATYSAGVETDVTITQSTDIKNFSWSVTYPIQSCYLGNSYSSGSLGAGASPSLTTPTTICATVGEQTITYNFDYISTTVTSESRNQNLPNVRGGVSGPITGNFRANPGVVKLIEQTSQTKNSRGEYTYSKSSTGIYV
jgi:hypothetical protein